MDMMVQIESNGVLTVPRLKLHQDHLLAGLIVAGYDDKKGGQAQSETPFALRKDHAGGFVYTPTCCGSKVLAFFCL